VAIDSLNPSTLWVGGPHYLSTCYPPGCTAEYRYVYRSPDAGDSWENSLLRFGTCPADCGWAGISDILIKEDDSDTVLVSMNGPAVGGVNRTTDGGQTWDWYGSGNANIHVLAADPTDPEMVYKGSHACGYVDNSGRRRRRRYP
jgi:hypothetical protein